MLVIYRMSTAEAEAVRFETDYKAAVVAYDRAEQDHRDDPDIEVVLLGSDSLETLERTHSSDFKLSEKHINQAVERELAALGPA